MIVRHSLCITSIASKTILQPCFMLLLKVHQIFFKDMFIFDCTFVSKISPILVHTPLSHAQKLGLEGNDAMLFCCFN